jgi:hypothetical protein
MKHNLIDKAIKGRRIIEGWVPDAKKKAQERRYKQISVL